MKQPFIGNHLFIDNSMLEYITTCPRSAYYNIYKQRELADARAALRFGDYAAHKPLAYRYLNEALGQPWSEEEQIKLMEKLFMDNPLSSEGYRNFNNAAKLIYVYNRNATTREPFKIVRHPKTNYPLVEKSFAILLKDRVRGYTISYCGRIDLVIELQTGVYVVDHKTTSMLGPAFWDSIAVDPQPRGYCWSLLQSTGIEPTGYMINALGVRESVDNAMVHAVTGELVMPSKSKARPIELERQRFYTKEPPAQLDEWYQNLLSQIDMFLYYSRDKDLTPLTARSFPMHRHNHCVGKYGQCQYYNVCSLPESQREMALESNAFRALEWSPLEQTLNQQKEQNA
jgi:hypothetical protein